MEGVHLIGGQSSKWLDPGGGTRAGAWIGAQAHAAKQLLCSLFNRHYCSCVNFYVETANMRIQICARGIYDLIIV